MKALIFCACLLLAGQASFAQPATPIDYKSLYKTCDSLNGLKQLIALDNGILKSLRELDKQTPFHLFAEALYYLDQKQFQEAAIFYQVGMVRQTYYIAVNNNYAPNGDWQYAESMKSIASKKVIPYLQTNADHYLQVLKLAIDYCENNDYTFSSKLNFPDKYQLAIKKLDTLKSDIEKNKETFQKNWDLERANLLAKKN